MGNLRIRLAVLVALIVVGGLIGAAAAFKALVERPPFLVVLEPAEDNTLVQFIQPLGLDDTMKVSPKFKIAVKTTEPFQAALTSQKLLIPNATIEHGDTTLLPGDFQIRFGNTSFRVMASRVVINSQVYDWLARPPESGAVVDLTTH